MRSIRLQLQEQQTLIPQLETERDQLAAEAEALRESLEDAERRLGSATTTLNQIRTEMERRTRDKDQELETIR